MNKIEQAGVDAKNHVLSEILTRTKKGDFEPSFCFIRGENYRSESDHLFSIANSMEATISLKSFINACKTHRDSRHQVDYVVASFVDKASISKIKVREGTSKEEINRIVDESVSSRKEASNDNTLIVFVMTEDQIEFFSYDVIELSGKRGEVCAVVSPEPVIYAKGSYYENRFYSSAAKIPNFFEISASDEAIFSATGLNYEGVFREDVYHYPPKDNESSSVKKTTKFGY